MRKASTPIIALTLLLLAALLTGTWYLATHSQRNAPEASAAPKKETTWTTLEPRDDVSAETSTHPGGRILECTDPDLGTFYTNAASCAQADVHNRLSVTESGTDEPKPHPYMNEGYQTPAQQAAAAPEKSESKNTSRDEGLSKACMFAIEKARDAEAVLNAAEDPQTSVWRADYCRWRCEVVKEKCELPPDYFEYGYRSLCPDEYLNGC